MPFGGGGSSVDSKANRAPGSDTGMTFSASTRPGYWGSIQARHNGKWRKN